MTPLHPTLRSPEITTSERIRGVWEESALSDFPKLVSFIALNILTGAILKAITKKTFAVYYFRTSLVFGALITIVIFEDNKRSRNFLKNAFSHTDLHLAVDRINKKYYWVKCASQNPRIDVLHHDWCDGASALHLAVQRNDLIATSILLQNPTIKQHINDRCLPLNQRKKGDLILGPDQLEDNNENENIKKKGGDASKKHCTPLHMAIMKSNVALVKLLLANGADPRIQDAFKSNASKFAEKNIPVDNQHGAEIMKILNEALSDPSWKGIPEPT